MVKTINVKLGDFHKDEIDSVLRNFISAYEELKIKNKSKVPYAMPEEFDFSQQGNGVFDALYLKVPQQLLEDFRCFFENDFSRSEIQ